MDVLKQAVVDPRSASLALSKNSHTVSKPRSKVRIVHIFSPEIIQTDVDNFRELVQRLTGLQPTNSKTGKGAPKKKKKKAPPSPPPTVSTPSGLVSLRCGYSLRLPEDRVKEELANDPDLETSSRSEMDDLDCCGLFFNDEEGEFGDFSDPPWLPPTSSPWK